MSVSPQAGSVFAACWGRGGAATCWADAGVVTVEIARHKQRAAIAANIVRPNLASVEVPRLAGLTSRLVLFMTCSVFMVGINDLYKLGMNNASG